MAEHSDVRARFYTVLKTFADAQSLRIKIAGDEFTPTDRETWLAYTFRTAEPSKPYAGFRGIDKESGFYQVDVIGPESRKQKAFELIAWDVREAYWPTASTERPTLGTNPIVHLGPTAPHVRDHPAPGEGRLGSVCTIYWHADFPKT